MSIFIWKINCTQDYRILSRQRGENDCDFWLY